MQIDLNNPLTWTQQAVAAEDAAADAMYSALTAGDKQAYQAAQRQYESITGLAAPGALQSNPWNLPGAAPPPSGTVESSSGAPYAGGAAVPVEVLPASKAPNTSRLPGAALPASSHTGQLAPATGRGALLSAERFRSMFLGAPVGIIATAGGPVGLVVGAVFSFLGGLFGSLFGGGGDANKAIQQLRDEFSNVSNALIQGFAQLARTVGQILKWIAAVIVTFIKTLFSTLGKLLGMLKDLYEKVLKPALQAIQKIRDKILKLYEHYMRPLLLVMQRVHQVLTVLKLFHLKFAAKLDAELMRIQQMITAPMYQLLGYINQLANMFNLVFDARMVLRRAVTLNALNDTKGSWTRMWWNAQTDSAWNAPAPLPQTPSMGQSATEARQAFELYAQTGAGPIAPQVDANLLAFQQYAKG